MLRKAALNPDAKKGSEEGGANLAQKSYGLSKFAEVDEDEEE